MIDSYGINILIGHCCSMALVGVFSLKYWRFVWKIRPNERR